MSELHHRAEPCVLSRRAVLVCLTWLPWSLAHSARGDAMSSVHVVPFESVDRGAHSGVGQPLHAIVRSSEEWTELWRRHAGPSAPPPRIDFRSEMLIAVFMGERRTGGYAVEILEARSSGPGLRVVYREHVPPPGAVVPQVLTTPFHIIRLARWTGRVDVVKVAP